VIGWGGYDYDWGSDDHYIINNTLFFERERGFLFDELCLFCWWFFLYPSIYPVHFALRWNGVEWKLV